jgi:hypothetical protein
VHDRVRLVEPSYLVPGCPAQIDLENKKPIAFPPYCEVEWLELGSSKIGGICAHRNQLRLIDLKTLPRQKTTTHHTIIHANTQSKLLIIFHASIYHTKLTLRHGYPKTLCELYTMSIPISHICIEQDKKHLLAFLLLAISTHAASYTRQTFLTLILIKKKGKELHELHPKPIASFFMLAPPSYCISLEPADL